MATDDNSAYADSAQARKIDRDMEERGKAPVAAPQANNGLPPGFHMVDVEAERAREAEELAARKARLKGALVKLEAIFGPSRANV